MKLDEIRDIRNLLAHNRALSRRTHVILAGLLASLEDVIDTFKRQILYGESDILRDNDDALGSHFEALLHGNDWSRFQAFVARNGNLIRYVSLPVAPFNRWPDAKLLLQSFKDHLDGIVAFCLNKTGDEFSVLAPKKVGEPFLYSFAESFTKNPNVWTGARFEEQEPRFVCSPKIWFYENRSPS